MWPDKVQLKSRPGSASRPGTVVLARVLGFTVSKRSHAWTSTPGRSFTIASIANRGNYRRSASLCKFIPDSGSIRVYSARPGCLSAMWTIFIVSDFIWAVGGYMAEGERGREEAVDVSFFVS